jgi:predicted SnoaL-like aldol condensation-catalyzing enzyme
MAFTKASPKPPARKPPKPKSSPAPLTPKAALRKYLSVWVEGKINLAERTFDPGIVRHHPPSIRPPEIAGLDAYKAFVTEFRNMHPELRIEVSETVSDGKFIAYRYTASALNPATSERFSFSGMALSKFSKQGKIVEEWVTWDTYDLMVQVGLVPPREP